MGQDVGRVPELPFEFWDHRQHFGTVPVCWPDTSLVTTQIHPKVGLVSIT